MNKYISADELKERICNHYNPKLYEHIFKIIDELSEEREEATKLDLETLKQIKSLFQMQSDHSTICNGYFSLCKEIYSLEQPNPLKVAIKGDGTKKYGKKII